MGLYISTPSRVFIACPFTPLKGKDGLLNVKVVKLVKSVLKLFRDRGHHVFSAHELEQWGTANPAPKDFTKRDLQGIDIAHYVVIMPSSRDAPSSGTSIEYGYASMKFLSNSHLARNLGISKRLKNKIKGFIILKPNEEPVSRVHEGLTSLLSENFPDKVHVIGFDPRKPSAIYWKLKTLLGPVKITQLPVGERLARHLASIGLELGRRLNLPRGATYFTRSPRAKPI